MKRKPAAAARDPAPPPGAGAAPQAAAAPIPAPPLPPAHAAFLERWLALEAALVFFGRRGEPCVFGRLKGAVEASSGRAFHRRHLGQMLALWPGAYVVRRQLRVADAA